MAVRSPPKAAIVSSGSPSTERGPRISLDQWRAFLAVVDAGGYAQAAERVHKSQSSITYAVKKLEKVLSVAAFEIQGRRAILTPAGQFLYRRAKALLDEAGEVERAARRLSVGWEADIGIAVEAIFPIHLMLRALDLLGQESAQTRIELIEGVLSGTADALTQGRAQLAVVSTIPPGYLGDLLMQVRFVAVAAPDHPLHQQPGPVTARTLRKFRHLVVRDSGATRTGHALLVDTAQRWTVSTMATSISAVRRGYGFAWFPEERIREDLDAGTLRILPLREGAVRVVSLYLVYADRDAAGPGVLRLAELVRQVVAESCPATDRP